MSVSVRNDLVELGRLQAELREFLRTRDLPDTVGYNLQLVLEELIVNIVCHAYEDADPHQISVSLTLTPDKALLEIEDDGRPFDPWNAPKPNTELPLEQRPIGGLGIHLVRNVAEQVGYRRAGGKNHLEVSIGLHAQ